MATTTFLLEELDDATRSYLIEVRDRQGSGMPGVFSPVAHPWGCGCGCGSIIIGLTLVLTLTTMMGVIYNDPDRVALLQTAGLLVGGWLVFSWYRGRGKRGDRATAGNWVYVDPLHLYQARAEQVLITPIADVAGATCNHIEDNNGKYQKSSVTLSWPGGSKYTLFVSDQVRAEQLITFINYVAWARGPEGGTRASLPPGDLGALGSAVARTEQEPHDADGNPAPSLTGVDVRTVPDAPHREKRSVPRVLPYIVLILAGAACFMLMREINIPLRDNATYDAVVEIPQEPFKLRIYLLDQRNTRHRAEVYTLLERFYTRKAIGWVRANGQDPELREGMAQVLDSLKRADLEVVSIRVKEVKSPAGAEGGAARREEAIRQGIGDKSRAALSAIEPKVTYPPNLKPPDPQHPVGEQLIAFVAMPEGAPAPHFDIAYRFEPAANGQYDLYCTVTVRTDVAANPVASKDLLIGRYPAGVVDIDAVNTLILRVVRDLIGSP